MNTIQIRVDQTTWEYVKKTLSEFPAIIPFVLPSDLAIEPVKNFADPFLTETSKRCVNGAVLENGKTGERTSSFLLIVDRNNSVLHCAGNITSNPGIFIRILEQSIREKEFGYCGFVVSTTWYEQTGKLELRPNEKTSKVVKKTVEAQICTLTEKQKSDSPEDILADLVLDYGLFSLFSEPFQADLIDYAQQIITRIKDEWQKRPDSKEMSEDYGFVSIKTVPFHKDVTLLGLRNNEGKVALMIHNRKNSVEIQSFNSSVRNAKKILNDTLDALQTTSKIEGAGIAS